jgi:exoribonuclease R
LYCCIVVCLYCCITMHAAKNIKLTLFLCSIINSRNKSNYHCINN